MPREWQEYPVFAGVFGYLQNPPPHTHFTYANGNGFENFPDMLEHDGGGMLKNVDIKERFIVAQLAAQKKGGLTPHFWLPPMPAECGQRVREDQWCVLFLLFP